MSLGDWIALMDEKAGIHQFNQEAPYYMNVGKSSPYYESVQAAVEWSVLDPSNAFDPSADLTREWAAYTLVNLKDLNFKQENNTGIRDLSKSRFPRHVSAAVASGMLRLDNHNRFLPTRAMEKQDALALLEQVVSSINRRTYEEPTFEFEWNDDVDINEQDLPEEINEEEGTATFSKEAEVEPGQYIHAYPGTPEETLFKVTDVEEQEDGKKVAKIKQAELEDIFESFSSSDTFTIDFSQAEIIDPYDGSVIQAAPTSYTENTALSLMAAGREKEYSRTEKIRGYTISYSVSATGMKAEVSKETKDGMEVFGNLTVTDVTPTYKWDMKNGRIDDGYLRVDFRSIESLGAKAESYKEMYGDFSRTDPRSFLGTVKNLFQSKQDAKEIELPLAEIHVPVPSAPALTVSMTMQLKIGASGRAELTLTQDHSIGMEIREGQLRTISDCKAKGEALVRGNTSLLGGVKLAMNMLMLDIGDITAEAGARADVNTIVHLYDKKGNHAVMADSEVPSDLVDDLSDGNGDILACADINAYKTANLSLNSSKSLLGKLGLSKSVPLIEESKSPLIPGMKTHMENGHFVDQCTRGDRLKPNENEKIVVSDQIRIAAYSMIANPGETKEIQVIALPKGYSLSDLHYASDRPSVASASGPTVHAVSEGSAIIHITTKDGKYAVDCTILVRQKK